MPVHARERDGLIRGAAGTDRSAARDVLRRCVAGGAPSVVTANDGGPGAGGGTAPPSAGTAARRPSLRERISWFGLAAAFLAADLWSKHLIFYPHVLEPGFREGVEVGRVASWWRTILVYNQGVTFGMFSDVPAWTKAALTGLVIVWLGRNLWTLPAGRRLQAASLAMVVGGAVGNLYDRTLRPAVEPDTRPGVRDFLDWCVPDGQPLAAWLRSHGVPTHWYTSNVADVLIVCGVILLAWCLLREPEAVDDGPPREVRA